MNTVSANRSSLSDLPADCIGQVVNQLAAISTPRRPLFRSLLRWSQTNKAMQAQLADWTRQYAKPADHVAQAFEKAFRSEAPVTRTLLTAKRFAMHLTADLIADAAFFRTNDGSVLFSAPKLALILVALAQKRKKFPEGAVESFLEKLETQLVPKQGNNYALTVAHLNKLEEVTRSIFKVCGLSLKNSSKKNACADECVDTLLMLPQPLKSVAMESAFKVVGLWDNTKFERLFVESMDQFIPSEWSDSFMGSPLGAATLDACECALHEFGGRSEKFVVAYSKLLGGFVAGLPVGQRDFRTLCRLPLGTHVLFTDESGASDDRSDDSDFGLLPVQRELKQMPDWIFSLLKLGRLVESGRQAFIRDFVGNALLTMSEFDVLMNELSRDEGSICSFKELATALACKEHQGETSAKRSQRKCVIS